MEVENAKVSEWVSDEKHPDSESVNQNLRASNRLSLSRRLLKGVELRGLSQISGSRVWLNFNATGIQPVAFEDRTETQFNKIFFIWLSANTNILSCVVPFISSWFQ